MVRKQGTECRIQEDTSYIREVDAGAAEWRGGGKIGPGRNFPAPRKHGLFTKYKGTNTLVITS